MSAGSFSLTRYASSYNPANIHPIRVQPETLLAVTIGATPVTNTVPTGAVNNPISAIVSRSKRSRGLMPRSIRIRLTGTPVPATYAAGSVTTIPVLQEAFYNACALGVTITYLGSTWTVVGRSPELAR
jgi:hypothetical protein